MRVKTLVLLSIFILPFVLLLAGATYQWSSEKADKALVPGQWVTVGGHSFHLLCRGSGSPLVLLENGLGGSYTDWFYTIDGIEKQTRVCAYDRLGLDWSGANDKPTRADDVAKYLNDLIQTAELEKPMIIVGFSAGGLYAREYYQQFPENVVGMVLIDSAHERQSFRIDWPPRDLSNEKFCSKIAWTGIGRIFALFDKYVEKSLPLEWQKEQLRAYNRTGFCEGLVMQSEGFVMDLQEGKSLTPMGNLPLVVISAGKPLREQNMRDAVTSSFLTEHEKIWPQLQEELAQLSDDSIQLVVKNSGHAIHVEQPRVVIKSLTNMIDKYRSRNVR